MKKLSDDLLLATTSHGVFAYNALTDRFELMPQLPTSRIQSIMKDHDGIIWVGTFNNGLYRYDPSNEQCKKYSSDSALFDENSAINDIYEDAQHNLWVATMDGIRKYDRTSGNITRYTVKNGLPSNMTFRILSDQSNNLWITTTNGLACLHQETGKITVYTQEHGLITNQFNYNSGWKDAYGRLYLGMDIHQGFAHCLLHKAATRTIYLSCESGEHLRHLE
jgi:ligand-binding sensor domain-containing protein